MIVYSDIVNTLVDEISNTINSSNSPYNSDIALTMRGIVSEDIELSRPFIGIYTKVDPVSETMYEGDIRTWNGVIYCYTEEDGYGNYDIMDQLYKDIRYFLKYDFSYKDYSHAGDLLPVELGADTTLGIWKLAITIDYEEEI